jgi:hypothetical protein
MIAVGTLLDGKGGLVRNTRIVVQGDKITGVDASASPEICSRTSPRSAGWYSS